MKKLIVVAVIAAGALASHAASFDWVTSSKAYAIDATTMANGLTAGTAYGVGSNNASSMSNQISSYGATWSYVMTLTSGAKTDTISGKLVAGDFSSRMINEVGLSSTIWDGASVDNPVTVNYSIVITGQVKDGKNQSWELTANPITGSQTFTGVGDLKITSAGPTGWTAAPEPTSGLLLLLGMAGLALKRKRA